MRRRVILLAGCALVACTESTGGGCVPGYGANGEIGEGAFEYVCAPNDQACEDDGAAGKAPATLPVVAREGSFGLRFRANPDAGVKTVRITPAVGRAVVERAGSFVGAVDGMEAMLGFETNGARVVDLVHVRVSTPTSLVFEGDGALAIGQERTVRATSLGAFTEDGGTQTPLLGGLAATYTVDDETVAGIVSQKHGRVKLVGKKAGTTTLVATTGPLTERLPLIVGGIGSEGGADANTDALIDGGPDAQPQ